MVYHGVDLLNLTVEVDGLSAIFFASILGFLLFVWPLRDVPLEVFIE